jgi:hypothetical protein
MRVEQHSLVKAKTRDKSRIVKWQDFALLLSLRHNSNSNYGFAGTGTAGEKSTHAFSVGGILLLGVG